MNSTNLDTIKMGKPIDDKKEMLYVIKVGGNVIEDETKLDSFLQSFSGIKENKILIHGGGKLATLLAKQLSVNQQLIDGRRITDTETLKIVTMVYAGYVNKNIVAQLQSKNCNALGLSGTDGNLIQAHKRKNSNIDYGFVGDIDVVNCLFIKSLLSKGLSLVIAPISHDNKGQLLNTNADTIAQEIAKAMTKDYEVHLIYSFEKSGLLLNPEDAKSVIKTINPTYYKELKDNNIIFDGMIPKLDNAFIALQQGVRNVVIGKAECLQQLISGESGTNIISQ